MEGGSYGGDLVQGTSKTWNWHWGIVTPTAHSSLPLAMPPTCSLPPLHEVTTIIIVVVATVVVVAMSSEAMSPEYLLFQSSHPEASHRG